MINVKELIEDFLALGYPDEVAMDLAKQEFQRRCRTLVANRRRQAKRPHRPGERDQ